MVKSRRHTIDKWVIQYYDGVFSLSLRLVGNRDDALDCSQEVFIKAWKKLDTFRGDSHPMAWLKRITYNCCYNHLNRNKAKKWNILDETQRADMPIPISQTRIFDPAHLQYLSVMERSVLVARIYDDLSFKELAEILDTTENSAKVSYHNAIKKLRKVMI